MTHVWKTDTLAQRLRALADELESAERYGLELPTMVSVSRGVYFDTTGTDLFAQWADYCEVEGDAEWTDDNDTHWHRTTADVNGLRVEFGGKIPSEVAA